MDEQILNNQQQTTTAATPATPTAEAPAAQPTTQQTTPLQSGVQAQPAENLPAGVSDYSAQIQQMYDAQLAAKQQSMEDAYNQNLVTMQRAKEQVAPTYFNQGNDLATQYERTRRNNNLQADANGLNTGAGSQMDLAQQSNFLDAFGRVRAAQANAERQADQQIADLEVAYKSQVAQALADNDYQKATALLAEYQRRDNAAEEMRRYNYQQQLADAKQRAAYGDFGGFSDLYGADTAKNMQQFWAFNNPDYALAMGMITPDQYQQATGYYPGSSGYRGSSGGGYYRSGGGGYRSSGSGGSSIEGSGVYDATGGTPSPSGAPATSTDADMQDYANFLRYVDLYGSESAAYSQMARESERTATGQAQMAAAALGLKPGTGAYTTFVNEQKAQILAGDSRYQSAQSGAAAYGELERAKAMEEQEKANREMAKYYTDMWADIDPVTGMSNAELRSQAQQSKADVRNAAGAVANYVRGVTTPYQPTTKPATVISGNKTSTNTSGTSNGGTKKVTNTKNSMA